jgi:SAM-dependent methyltransferase
MGSAYLRYSFTKGTIGEVDTLVELAGLDSSSVALDVGCGPGRHALELASRGVSVVGVDISSTFVDLATEAASAQGQDRTRFVVGDARALIDEDAVPPGSFDLVYSLCQGAFGLTAGPGAVVEPGIELDEPVLAGMAAAVRPGGSVIVSAFSAYFQLRFADDGDRFDADLGVNAEDTVVRDPDGVERAASLWTTCYTPRELRLLARTVGLEPVAVHGVTPGRYSTGEPATDCPEFLLVARRPIGGGIAHGDR